jgi:hypothetical protein
MRGGYFLVFNGVRTHQAESLLKDGRTSAQRAFCADGNVFSLIVIGGKQPVEQDEDFEKVMKGFAFMKPPAQALRLAPSKENRNISYQMGDIAGVATLIAISAGLLRSFTRKKSPAPPISENAQPFA